MSRRMEKQLVLKQTVLSRMLGGTVIADVAIIGTDMFFREGASYGILFQARSNLALSASLAQQRAERIKRRRRHARRRSRSAGTTVSYLSSPDGTVRSYYVADGDFHFVATSRRLVERFLATATGQGSLGGVEGVSPRPHRSCRLSRDDTVWLYLSDAFFRNITGPKYRIEMARRLQAAADIELVQLAQPGRRGRRAGRAIRSSSSRPAACCRPSSARCPTAATSCSAATRSTTACAATAGSFLPVSDVPVEQRHAGRGLGVQQVRRLLSCPMGTDGPDHRRRETHGRWPAIASRWWSTC